MAKAKSSKTVKKHYKQERLSLIELWRRSIIDNYSNFSGRATRREYWYVCLMNFIIAVSITILTLLVSFSNVLVGIISVVYFIIGIALFIPMIALSFRRLHDTNRSAWWLLISILPLIGSIALLVFYALTGDEDSNDYGPPADYTG